MTEVTAYNNPFAPINRQWIAYMVMDSGQLWGVYAIGSSEDEAKSKIKTLWESERARVPTIVNPWVNLDPTQQRHGSMEEGLLSKHIPHHLAGLVWLINKADRTKCRVSAETAETMIASGDWERGGPRSK